MNIYFTKHLEDERILEKQIKGKIHVSKQRKFKGLSSTLILKLLTPYEEKYRNKGKSLLMINKNKESNIRYYILFTIENDTLVIISSLETETIFLKYKNIPIENRLFLDNVFLDDFVKKEKIKKIKQVEQPKINSSVKIIEKKDLTRKSIKKIQVEKPNKNELKECSDMINSNLFDKLPEIEKTNLINRKNKLEFYSNFKYIFNEELINDFLVIYNKLTSERYFEAFNENVTKEHLSYVLDLYVDNIDYKTIKKRERIKILNIILNLKNNLN